MLSKLNFPTHVVAIWICAVSLMLGLVAAGCGTDEDTYIQTSRTENPAQARTATPAPVPEPAAAEIVESAPLVPEPPREVTYDEAETAYLDRNYDEAVELFTRYTSRKTGNPWGYYMLGLSAWKANKLDTAEDAFNRALVLDANHVKSYVNLSRVLLDMARPADAIVQIDAALALDPESNVAYRLQGRAFHQLGRNQEAIAAYRQAILIDGEDAWAMNNLALVLIEDERFEEALPPLARAVELRDDVAVFLNNLGMALERTGRFRAAEAAYASAVTIDETYDRAAMNFDRIAGVLENPEVGVVDLPALAQQFVESLSMQSGTLVANERVESESVVQASAASDTSAVGQ